MFKLKKRLVKIFQIVFALSMLLIFVIALSRPLNNLVPGRMAVYTLFWIVLFCGLWWLVCTLEKRFPSLEKKLKAVFPLFLILYGIALYVVSCLLRSEIFTDYGNVYEAALNFALGEEVTNWEYFAMWYNNVGSMLMLSFLFFLGSKLPVTVDLYYIVLFFNVLQVMLVIACLYYLAGMLIKNRSLAARMMVMAVSTLWIPIWANSSIFYSDQLSFGAGVFGVTLLVKGWEKRNWPIYIVVSGAVFAVGMTLKVTSATIVVALFITGFVFSKLWSNRKKISVLIAGFLGMYLAYTLFCGTLPYQEDAKRLKIPVEYWIAIGLGENGTYSGSEEFAIRCTTTGNREESREIAREQIASQIHNLWNPEHIVAKMRTNFGCGDMGAAGYLIYPKNENFLWNWFSQEGEYFWKYACISTAFFFSVLFLLGIGGMVQFFRKEEMREEELLFFAAELAFWGLCLFLMLWEAQDKQLYNHSGWMMLSLIYCLNLLDNVFADKTHKLILAIKKGKNTNDGTED